MNGLGWVVWSILVGSGVYLLRVETRLFRGDQRIAAVACLVVAALMVFG